MRFTWLDRDRQFELTEGISVRPLQIFAGITPQTSKQAWPSRCASIPDRGIDYYSTANFHLCCASYVQGLLIFKGQTTTLSFPGTNAAQAIALRSRKDDKTMHRQPPNKNASKYHSYCWKVGYAELQNIHDAESSTAKRWPKWLRPTRQTSIKP